MYIYIKFIHFINTNIRFKGVILVSDIFNIQWHIVVYALPTTFFCKIDFICFVTVKILQLFCNCNNLRCVISNCLFDFAMIITYIQFQHSRDRLRCKLFRILLTLAPHPEIEHFIENHVNLLHSFMLCKFACFCRLRIFFYKIILFTYQMLRGTSIEARKPPCKLNNFVF